MTAAPRSPRHLSLLACLVALLLSTLVGPGVGRAQADTGCSSTGGSLDRLDPNDLTSPYGIDSAADLQLLKESPTIWNESFTVTSNISMAGCTWTSTIGEPGASFTGTFDGDGFSITDLTVTVTTVFAANPAQGLAGLFGVVDSGAVIRDLHVRGRISLDVTTDGAFAYAGGIVARAENAQISGSSFTGTVTAHSTQDHPHAGGILGAGTDVILTSVNVRANVSATEVNRASAGGIVGVLNASGPGTAAVRDSWVIGSVVSDGHDQSSTGGIVGWSGRILVENSFAEVTVRSGPASEPAGGGIVGGGRASMLNTYARGSITTTRMTGGLMGWSTQDNAQTDAIRNSYFVGSLANGGDRALGGIAGRTDYVSTNDFQAPGSVWNTQVSSVSDPAGYSEFLDGSGTETPTVNGGNGRTTAEMTTLATYSALGWSISDTDTTSTWTMCPQYNDGYPFLRSLFSTSPCSAPPAGSMTPETQTISGVVGTAITTSAPTVTGFASPFFSVSPALPSGLSLDPLTGVISGTVQNTVPTETTYTITAISGSLPLQRATSTITQSASPPPPPPPPPPPLDPGQITQFTEDSSTDGLYQAVATRPTDGYALAVAYATGSVRDTFYAILLDEDGGVVGNPIAFVPETATVNISQQPAVAFNPVSGGWLVCYTTESGGDTTATCQYLHADGTPDGAAFALADPINDRWNQSAIAYNPATERFLVASTSYYSGAMARFIDANGTGPFGAAIDIATEALALPGAINPPALNNEGGIDLAYSPVSDTYLLLVRARTSQSEQSATWFYHLNGSGIPTRQPVRFDSDTDLPMTNGSVAYNAADDEFMVVTMSQQGLMPLGALRVDAASGTPVAGGPQWTNLGAPFTPADPPPTPPVRRYRPAIAAHASAGEFLVTLPITLAADNPRVLRYYVVPLAADGTGGTPVYVDGTPTEPSGNRPRIAFNESTCEFLTTYQKNSAAWSFQLFAAAIPANEPCASAPTITDVQPATGSTAGGTTVTISGTGFQSGVSVTFGGAIATVTSVVETRVVAVTPPRSPGATDITVTNPDSGTVTATGAFTYVRPQTPQPVTPVTPTPSPTPTPTPTATPPRTLGLGEIEVTVNGVRDERLSVSPDGSGRNVLVSAQGVRVTVAGVGPDGRRLTLSPAGAVTLESGRGVRASGRGLLSSAVVTVSLLPRQGNSAESVTLGTFTADAQGSFSGRVTVPATVAPGDAVLHIVSRTPRNDVWTLRLGVQVRPSLTVTATRVRTSDARSDRVRLTGTVTGIPTGANVTPQIRIGTRGAVVSNAAAVRVSSDGTFTWSRTVPRGSDVTVSVRHRDSESNQVALTRIR